GHHTKIHTGGIEFHGHETELVEALEERGGVVAAVGRPRAAGLARRPRHDLASALAGRGRLEPLQAAAVAGEYELPPAEHVVFEEAPHVHAVERLDVEALVAARVAV